MKAVSVILSSLDPRTEVNAQVLTVEEAPQLLMEINYDFTFQAYEDADYMDRITVLPNFDSKHLPFLAQAEIVYKVSEKIEDAFEDFASEDENVVPNLNFELHIENLS